MDMPLLLILLVMMMMEMMTLNYSQGVVSSSRDE